MINNHNIKNYDIIGSRHHHGKLEKYSTELLSAVMISVLMTKKNCIENRKYVVSFWLSTE